MAADLRTPPESGRLSGDESGGGCGGAHVESPTQESKYGCGAHPFYALKAGETGWWFLGSGDRKPVRTGLFQHKTGSSRNQAERTIAAASVRDYLLPNCAPVIVCHARPNHLSPSVIRRTLPSSTCTSTRSPLDGRRDQSVVLQDLPGPLASLKRPADTRRARARTRCPPPPHGEIWGHSRSRARPALGGGH